jgi:hypothetical protein
MQQTPKTCFCGPGRAGFVKDRSLLHAVDRSLAGQNAYSRVYLNTPNSGRAFGVGAASDRFSTDAGAPQSPPKCIVGSGVAEPAVFRVASPSICAFPPVLIMRQMTMLGGDNYLWRLDSPSTSEAPGPGVALISRADNTRPSALRTAIGAMVLPVARRRRRRVCREWFVLSPQCVIARARL